mgnify:CR=1 FL=1
MSEVQLFGRYEPPMANGEVFFEAPWQGRVFAMAVTLAEQGCMAWSDFQGMLIEVEEAYTHCPRALNFSHLWDAEEIRKNKETSPIPERTDENYFDHQEGQ